MATKETERLIEKYKRDHSAPIKQPCGFCNCYLPRQQDCDRLGYPEGCFYADKSETAEDENRKIQEAMFGFDSFALGYHVT